MSRRKKQGWKRSNAPWYGRNATAKALSVEKSFEDLRKRQGNSLSVAVARRVQDLAAIRQAVFGTLNARMPENSPFAQKARPSEFEQLLESELERYEKLYEEAKGSDQGGPQGDDGEEPT